MSSSCLIPFRSTVCLCDDTNYVPQIAYTKVPFVAYHTYHPRSLSNANRGRHSVSRFPVWRLQSLERSTLGRFEALNPRHRRSHILSNENRLRSLLLAHATTSNLKYIYAHFTFNSEDCCRLGRQTIGLGQRFGVDREVIAGECTKAPLLTILSDKSRANRSNQISVTKCRPLGSCSRRRCKLKRTWIPAGFVRWCSDKHDHDLPKFQQANATFQCPMTDSG